jgi:hypothetical protein
MPISLSAHEGKIWGGRHGDAPPAPPVPTPAPVINWPLIGGIVGGVAIVWDWVIGCFLLDENESCLTTKNKRLVVHLP